MRARLLVPLLFLVVAGCDSSGDDLVLDNDFYVGSWTLVGVSDTGGDRTEEVLALVDDFDATFRADQTFDLTVDLIDAVNAAGQPDVALSGTYQTATSRLVLVIDGLAPAFDAEAESRSHVALTAPGFLVSQILGAGLQIEFSGDVTIDIERQ